MQDRRLARQWYRAAFVLSVLALVGGLISLASPRLGYTLGFVFTVFGVFALTRPSWPRRRVRLVVLNGAVLLSQVAILWLASITASAQG